MGGRFRLIAPVGAGGPGRVWRAADWMSRHDVAVKVLDASPAGDAVAQARFRLVARTVVQLSGPGVAPVHEYGEVPLPEGTVLPYVVRDLVEGPTLAERLAEGSLPAGEALRVVAAVAGALAAAHRAGVPHGHLTPANIVLGPDGVRVTDFGLWALRRHRGDGMEPSGLSFQAPELAGGGAATPAADMYALGVVFIACLAGIGHRPAGADDAPPGTGPGTGAERGVSGGSAGTGGRGAPFDTTALDSVPPGLAAMWAACLSPSPMERPSAAHAAVMSRQLLSGDRPGDTWARAADPVVALDRPAWPGPPRDQAGGAGSSRLAPAPSAGAAPEADGAPAAADDPATAAASAQAASPAPAGSPAPTAHPGPAEQPGRARAPAPAGARAPAGGSPPDELARRRRGRPRHRRLVTVGGAATGATAAAAVVAVLVFSLSGRPASPGAAAAHTSRAQISAGAQPSLVPTGHGPTPEVTRPVLASTAPPGSSGSPAPPLTPLAAVSQLTRTISADVAAGQMRPDVGLDFDNLLQPVRTELAQGQPTPVAQLAVTLRGKLWTRVSEGAITLAAADVLDSEISALSRSAASS